MTDEGALRLCVSKKNKTPKTPVNLKPLSPPPHLALPISRAVMRVNRFSPNVVRRKLQLSCLGVEVYGLQLEVLKFSPLSSGPGGSEGFRFPKL